MSILIDKNTKVICQGFTGKNGTFHSEQAIAYGTKMVGGTSPGKGGTTHLNLPVFDTVAEAKEKTGCDASVIYVPPAGAADAIAKSIQAEIPLIICITEGIPVADMVKVKRDLCGSKSRLIGPNCPGVMTAGRVQDRHHARQHLQARQGRHRFALGHAHLRGGVPDHTARVSARPRPSGIGGDPVKGTEFIDVLEMFLADKDDRGDHHDRRNRRLRRRGRGAVPHRRSQARPQEADRRFHRRPHRAARPPHGPCRRDHFRRQGRCRIQDRCDGGGRHQGFAVAGPARQDAGRGAAGASALSAAKSDAA